LTCYVINRELELVMAAEQNLDFTKPHRALGRLDRLAEQYSRGDIAHRLSTTVRNLIAFFG
jgi:hypothetical protein